MLVLEEKLDRSRQVRYPREPTTGIAFADIRKADRHTGIAIISRQYAAQTASASAWAARNVMFA